LGRLGRRRRPSPTTARAPTLLLAGQFFDGNLAGKDVTSKLTRIAWDVCHGHLG
jgi:hypothetical protein